MHFPWRTGRAAHRGRNAMAPFADLSAAGAARNDAAKRHGPSGCAATAGTRRTAASAGGNGRNRGLLVRAELVDTVRALVAQARRRQTTIDRSSIAAHLYTAGIPDLDLLIRTS